MELIEVLWERFKNGIEDAKDWCADQNPYLRIPIVLWLLWVLVYLWTDPPIKKMLDFPNIFSGINLGIHEMGHILFRPMGMFMGILGGSLLQCLAPFGGMVSFSQQRDYFAMAVCGGWLSSNLFNVGTYMSDSIRRDLPLVSPFSKSPLHDWAYLFDRMGLLRHCETIGFLTKVLGTVIMLISLAAMGQLLLWMIHPPKRFQANFDEPYDPRIY